APKRRRCRERDHLLDPTIQCRILAAGRGRYEFVYQHTLHHDEFPSEPAGRGCPGRRQHRPEFDSPLSSHGGRLANPLPSELLAERRSELESRIGDDAAGESAGTNAAAGDRDAGAESHHAAPAGIAVASVSRSLRDAQRLFDYNSMTASVAVSFCAI